MRVAHALRVATLLALVAPAGRAQARGAPATPASLREELQRVQAVHERIVRTRLRYDLGLPVQAQPYFALSDGDLERSKEAAEKQLVDEQARVSGLGTRLAAAEEKLALAQKRVADAMAVQEPTAPGKAAAPRVAQAARPAPAEPFTIADEPPAMPAEERAPPAAAAAGAVVLLHGSEDHSRVGRALFFAKHYERARQELEAAVRKTQDLVDLFYLARSCEALGDTGKADELYLQVEAKDTQDVDGRKQPGSWARAARVARRQMQWMRDNGTWQPARPIEAQPWRNR